MTQFNSEPKVTAGVIFILCVGMRVRECVYLSEYRSYLAALAGMDTIVEARGHVATHFAQQH